MKHTVLEYETLYFNHVSIVFVTHHNDHGVDGEGIVDDAADGVLEAEALDPVNPAQISPQTIDGEILSSESCNELIIARVFVTLTIGGLSLGFS